ncbi:glycosyltransferase family A protein [Humibacillus xanthopallidus]|uniref:Glycosyl transferase family 2 n=1 Tax=Humibacillus xanthopallidus TaxID=412689 RepID=A0A543I076_9MICO|nr:glycosyltransferase family A protein [Humibacillus xanthopallidus]TQM63998.1 glycosyl transferase family 2 [Humibacillus xanthopallidus]
MTSAARLDYDVVIPTHGRDLGMLRSTLDSVRGQSLPARSVIVVVDGNPAAAEHLRRTEPDLDVLVTERPVGAGVARQRGIERARAEWVAFVDDDDLWAPRKQQVTAEHIAAHPGCAAVRTAFWTFTTPGSGLERVSELRAELVGATVAELESAAEHAAQLNDMRYLDIEGHSLALMLERNRGVIGSSVVRRSLLQSLAPVPEGVRPGEDHLLLTLVARHAEWLLIPERLLYYRLHPGQDTRRPDPAAARSIIRSRQLAWQRAGDRAPLPLTAYGPVYRRELRRLLWPLLRDRHLGEFARTYRAAWSLLPHVSDRALLLVPEPVVWRLVHRRRERRPAPSIQDLLGSVPDGPDGPDGGTTADA